MNRLPEAWARVTLGEVSAPRGEKANPSDLDDLPFIGLEEVEAHTGRVIRMQTTAGLKSAVALFGKGDLLYGRLRPYLNKVVLAEDSGAASAEFIVLPPSEVLDQSYLQRTLMSPDFVQFTGLRSTGDRPRVSFGAVSDYQFPLPPLPEQARIVAKIDSLTGKSRRARAHLDHIPRLVEKYKRAILSAAFRGDLTREWREKHPPRETAQDFISSRQCHARQIARTAGKGRDEKTAQLLLSDELDREVTEFDAERPLPENWSWALTGSVFGVYVGATPSRKEPEYWGGVIPWVSSGEVAFCRIATTDEAISEAGLANTSTRLHPPGTVLLGMIGEGKTRGQVAVLDIPACNNQNCASIRVSEASYSAEYVYWYLLFVYQQTRGVGAGNNQPALNKERVQKLLLPIAPVYEAHEIAEVIGRAFAWIDRLASEATSARRLIDRLDQAVLAKAFRGELVPQDPNDEPAEKLLERIRSARVAQPRARRGRRARIAVGVPG